MKSMKRIIKEQDVKAKSPYITLDRTPFFDIAKNYVRENSKFLDVGSGNGAFAKHLNRIVLKKR